MRLRRWVRGIVAVSERNVGEVKVGLEAVRTLGKVWVAR